MFLSSSAGVDGSLVTKDTPAFYLTALLGGENIFKREKMLQKAAGGPLSVTAVDKDAMHLPKAV